MRNVRKMQGAEQDMRKKIKQGLIKPIDLHVHSSCSDGTFSPTQLVDYAMEKGLAAFALTDHDTVDGLDEAIEYAAKLRAGQAFGANGRHGHGNASEEEPGNAPVPENFSAEAPKNAPASESPESPAVPEVVPGIELSSEYRGADIHVVGLYIDYHNESFRRRLKEFVDSRTNRNQKMCARLQQAGIPITYEELLAAYPDSVITRAHYAEYMLKKGYIKSRQEAFERYVGDRAPCYVPRKKITPAQAVQLILQAGGAPVLAHPILYHMSEEHLDTLTGELKEAGLMGIEAIYSTYDPPEERQIHALAAKYGLFISGGTDFHGANKPGLDLGTGFGKLFVPQDLLREVRKALDIR